MGLIYCNHGPPLDGLSTQYFQGNSTSIRAPTKRSRRAQQQERSDENVISIKGDQSRWARWAFWHSFSRVYVGCRLVLHFWKRRGSKLLFLRICDMSCTQHNYTTISQASMKTEREKSGMIKQQTLKKCHYCCHVLLRWPTVDKPHHIPYLFNWKNQCILLLFHHPRHFTGNVGGIRWHIRIYCTLYSITFA